MAVAWSTAVIFDETHTIHGDEWELRMSNWQSPSVCRDVHYVSHGTPVRPDGTQEFESECRAAKITAVHDDTTVSLVVFNPTGLFFHNRVYLDGTGKHGGTWHWPERV
jgi:hypothetical protein